VKIVIGCLAVIGGFVVLLFIVGLFASASLGHKVVEDASTSGSTLITNSTPGNNSSSSPKLEIQSFKCTWETFGGSGGYAYVEGEVKNISNEALKDIEAVGTWYTDNGQFVRSDDALLQFNPVLPGQVSPFKTFSSYNPAMAKCGLKFQSLFGGTVSSTAIAGAAQ
jgi:hypothetical protein